jgi:hypothetical protein
VNRNTLPAGILVVCAFMTISCSQVPVPLAESPRVDELKTRAGEIVSLLAAGEFAGVTSHFDAKMKSAFPEAKMRDTWNSLTGQIGAFESAGGKRAYMIGKHEAVFVTSHFANATMDIQVIFNPESQVSGLWIKPPMK